MLRETESMSQAGAAIMSGYWDEATKHERDVRDAANSEAVHDMRVAIRRLRVAFTLFRPWYENRELRGFNEQLRRLARRLGTVRDGEVLLQNARAAAPQLPTADLSGLLAQWEVDYAAARLRLLDYLDEPDFRRFRRRFERFLGRQREPEASDGEAERDGGSMLEPSLVCDVMPAEIWRRYGSVHAYLAVALEASAAELHALRIAGKHLRYALESFQELLGPAGKGAVGTLREMQDVLGAVHDAHVAIALLEGFSVTHADRSDRVEPYIEMQQTLLATSRARFESLWTGMNGTRLRQHIADCAGSLAGLSRQNAADAGGPNAS